MLCVKQTKATASTMKMVDFDALKLPTVPCRPGEPAWTFTAVAANTSEKVTVCCDGGAEADTISGKCASRVMRAQKAAKDAGVDPRAFLRMGRYPVPQEFGGYLEDGVTAKVDVEADLGLVVDGKDIPPFPVRVVVHQKEDLLVCAGRLDRWGFSRDDVHFELKKLGISAPRDHVVRSTQKRVTWDEEGKMSVVGWTVGEPAMLEPGEISHVSIRRQVVNGVSLTAVSARSWLGVACPDWLTQNNLMIAEGPVSEGTKELLLPLSSSCSV
jgi:hypothetical protein